VLGDEFLSGGSQLQVCFVSEISEKPCEWFRSGRRDVAVWLILPW